VLLHVEGPSEDESRRSAQDGTGLNVARVVGFQRERGANRSVAVGDGADRDPIALREHGLRDARRALEARQRVLDRGGVDFRAPCVQPARPAVVRPQPQRTRDTLAIGTRLAHLRSQDARDALPDATLIVAGSVHTARQIHDLARAGVDAFTIGSAVFDGSFSPAKGALRGQILDILEACDQGRVSPGHAAAPAP